MEPEVKRDLETFCKSLNDIGKTYGERSQDRPGGDPIRAGVSYFISAIAYSWETIIRDQISCAEKES